MKVYIDQHRELDRLAGICYVLFLIGHEDAYHNMGGMFPELWAQKPKRLNSNRWWPLGEWGPRKEALRKAIEMSKPKER